MIESKKNTIYSFPPVKGNAPILLILGSMPGKASLLAGEYYAHPRNVFWKILCQVFGSEYHADYQHRIYLLKSHGIALWDVCRSAIRETSLDSDISAEVPNDIPAFLRMHPTIKRVAFNGGMPAKLHDKYFERLSRVTYQTLLSTSPANAGYTFEEKLNNWRNFF
ncbi:MAG: DNA-deoxyinosine glycosylase [Bacteroidales bacterium]